MPAPETIVDTARDLLEAEGPERFSMRKLGSALGVSAMAVYQHFDSKDQLLEAVTASVLNVDEVDVGDGPWEDRAVALAVAIRDRFEAVTQLVPAKHAPAQAGAAMLRASEAGLELMEEIGYADDAAIESFRVLFWHAVGAALARPQMEAGLADSARTALAALPDEDVPRLARLLPRFGPFEPDDLFERSTRAVVAGLRASAP